MKNENETRRPSERARRAGAIMAERGRSEPKFTLRPATPDDYPFALGLYVDGSAGHLKKIGRWNERRVVSKFKRTFKAEEARIIRVGGEDVGWIQIVDFVRRLHLRQLHMIARVQGRGIGTRLIEDLQARGLSLGKPVTLDVIHGNRAKELYLRLGFKPTRADLDKTRMVWRRPRAKAASAKRYEEAAARA